MEYTQNFYDVLVVLGVLGTIIGFLAGKGELFKNW